MKNFRPAFALICGLLTLITGQAAEPNAALKYWQAFSTFPDISDELNDKIKFACTDAGLAEDVDEELVELLSKAKYSLRMLDRGAAIESCDWGADMRADGAETLLPHLGKARQLAMLALIRARHAFEQGDTDQALKDIADVSTLARHTSHDSTIVGLFVGYAIDWTTVRLLVRYLPTIDADQLLRTMERRHSAPKMSAMPDAIGQEEQFLEWGIAMLRVEDENQLLKFCSILTTSPEQRKEMLAAVGDRQKCLDHLIALKPLYTVMRRVLELPAEEFAVEKEKLNEQLQGNPAGLYLAPSIEAMFKAASVNTCRIALLDAAVAIHVKGRGSLASHPDPFGDGPFEYTKLSETSFRLESKLQHAGDGPVSLTVGFK